MPTELKIMPMPNADSIWQMALKINTLGDFEYKIIENNQN